MTEGQKEARKLFANLLNGIAIGSVTGATITPLVAFIVGTRAAQSFDWWNLVGFVVSIAAAAAFLHLMARRVVLGIS